MIIAMYTIGLLELIGIVLIIKTIKSYVNRTTTI